MANSFPPDQSDDQPFDPRQPGRARTVYTIVAVLVVISLVLSIAGYALWDRLF